MQGMTVENALLLIAVLVPVLIYSWLHLGTYQLDVTSKQEGKHTRKLTNANYGAYIQSQGRYYN